MATLSPLTAALPSGIALPPHEKKHADLDFRYSSLDKSILRHSDMPSAFGLIDAEVIVFIFPWAIGLTSFEAFPETQCCASGPIGHLSPLGMT